MLFLHHGDFSGINASVLDAWRRAAVCDVTAIDLTEHALTSWPRQMAAASVAARTMGLRLLRRGYGGIRGAVKRTSWYAEELEHAVAAVLKAHPHDFSVSMQTIVPVRRPLRPNFVFTDHTILCNYHYPGGAAAAERWQEYQPYEQATIRGATAVFTMSESARQTLVNRYHVPEHKAVCVRGGAVAATSPPDPKRYERANIVFVGFDWERKGGPELVAAFAEVRRAVPSATLTIVGCAPRVDVPGVTVVGPVHPDEVGRYLARASVFCMPSRREPFGLVYLEAMRASLPVVALRQGAVVDFVVDAQTGFLTDGTTAELASVLTRLVTDPERCRQIGEAARALVATRYTWEQTQQSMWNVIRPTLVA